jgi:type IV pilus assembly protein PilQ
MKLERSIPQSLTLTIMMLTLVANLNIVNAQKLPIPQVVSTDQMVSFPPTTSFEQAIQVLNLMATKFVNRVIIDPTGQKGPINIEIPPCHWLKALEILLGAYNLEYVDKGSYLEIVSPTSKEEKAPPAPAAAPSGKKELDRTTREIEISAVFFEGDKHTLAEVGVDWTFLADKSNIDIKSLTGSFVTQNFFNIASKYADRQGRLSITGLLQTFEAMNIGTIIARPTIIVMDGTEGMIQVGQSFSIKQKDFAGNTVERFFDVGTILRVTPKIIQDGNVTFIHLNIHAEKSSATPDPISTKIDKQLATTNVLLVNGEQTAIAGLYAEQKSKVRKGIPKLKDLPWWVFGLRYLTGYNSEDLTQKELVIIIKAELIPTLEERLKERRPNLQETIDRQREKYPEPVKP